MPIVLLPLGAFVAGLISFSSPCCLPLIPGYLSYVSALPVAELGERQARSVVFRASLLFVAGFGLVFTALGVASGLLGSLVARHLPTIIRVAGVGIIVLGLVTLGALRFRWLMGERRLDLARVPRGPAWALPLGMAFAAGWTPCIGPILATILATAAASGTAWWGAILLLFYSAGLGLPFVALALGFSRARGSLDFLRRHGRHVEAIGGVLMIAVGVLFVRGVWKELFLPLQREFAKLGWPPV
ncbi:MAG: sulfite exporter TauE/SafE family protein [Actinobacteria bacterium]|nr:sulfite exporter TauE/SafE family protein [Actinomycetota bacterium]